jgi:hypothetical protein
LETLTMFLSALSRRHPAGSSPARRRAFRPNLEVLKDRLVPSGAGSSGGSVNFLGNRTIWDIPDYYAQLAPSLKGTLGAVVAPETKTGDGLGSYELFQYGAIYCSSFTGAHALYGDIYQKWTSMRWDRTDTNRKGGLIRTLYYPSTDITSLANGDSCAHFAAYNPWEHQNDVAAIDDVGVWVRPKVNPTKPSALTESFTASAVDGLIAQKLAALGWENWGEAITDVTLAPDGKGQYVHFQQPTNSGVPVFEAIDWTPDFGAHDVNWRNGWEFSGLGAEKFGEAISDTAATPDHQGKSNHFVKYVNGNPTSFAAIDWTKQYGNHYVAGDFGLKFRNLNWEKFGEAITDVTLAPDGVGKFVHFLQGSHFKAIDWTPDYGLHTIDGAIADKFFEHNAAEGYGEAVTDVTSQVYGSGLSGSYVHLFRYDTPNSNVQINQHFTVIDSTQYGTWVLDGFLGQKFLDLGGESGFGMVTWEGQTKDKGWFCWVQAVADPDPDPHFIYSSSLGVTGEIDGEMYWEWINHGAKTDQNGFVIDPGPFGYPTSAVEHKSGGVVESQFEHGAIQVNHGEAIDEFWVLQKCNSNVFTFSWSSHNSYWHFLVSDQAGSQQDDSQPNYDNKSESSGSYDYTLFAHTTYEFNVDPATTYGTYGINTHWVGWMTPMDFTPGQVGPPPPPSGGHPGGGYGWGPAKIVFASPLTHDGQAPSADQGFTARWTDKNIGGEDTPPASYIGEAYEDHLEVWPEQNGWYGQSEMAYETDVIGDKLFPGDTNDQEVDIPGLPEGDYTVDVWLPDDFEQMHVHVMGDPDGQGQAPPPRPGSHLSSLLAAALDPFSAAAAVLPAPNAVIARPALDVTAQLAISLVNSSLDPTTKRYEQTVTIKNTSGKAIVGPLSVVLDNLSGNAMLVHKTGITTRRARARSPYLDVTLENGVLDAGTSVTIQLAFTDPSSQPITYTARVLAGMGQR